MLFHGRKIVIVGLGLIGGSYAMALHRQGYTVGAVDIDPAAIAYALKHNIIDEGAVSGTDLLKDAGLIVSGLYPTAVADFIRENQALFQPGCIVTDVSGVKRAVLYEVQAMLRPDVEFIGAHPMAGREVGGVQNSDDRIFQDANFIVTPTDKNRHETIELIKSLGKTLGFSRISELSPEEHDRMVGYLSQLTHVIAVSLMNANGNENLVAYTGDSFRDLTRIAKINDKLWTELFLLNRDVLVPEIDSFVKALLDMRQKIVEEDREGLKRLFIQSTKRRKLFDKPKQ